MEMRKELPWLHVPWTRIYYYGGTVRFSFNGNEEASPFVGHAACAATITMPLDWAWAMEMENGEDVRGSPTRQQEMRGALLYTGGGFRG